MDLMTRWRPETPQREPCHQRNSQSEDYVSMYIKRISAAFTASGIKAFVSTFGSERLAGIRIALSQISQPHALQLIHIVFG
ncbi:hypothetical protein MJO28_011066 [Puccinia striiformis f. sp. tritici]|uniref:Uncharacterized protein n=1 Tax=Puccinia striiformis f. sp. tritici TaxID=168172 RepID=A0ACC0E433_9BASI|nr:hypothetical protein MJO28_011066 [Puccinia striiformis f. sp. tritici]KAI7946295.1 hypothetical protein MJO29_010822 [Puccinia striiformis f. sp. tritici]